MADLTKIGFDELVEVLIARLREKSAWKDTNLTSTGRTIIELYAYVAQLWLYYLKRTYEELFVDSAVYWESLVKVANMLEVYVKRPVGCFGYVVLRRKKGTAGDVDIPRKTVLACDGVPFYVANSVRMLSGEDEVQVLVRQGALKVLEFVFPAVGGVRYDYCVSSRYASDVDLDVYVNGLPYKANTYLLETLDDRQVKVWTNEKRDMVVTFVRGFGMPAPGDSVRIEYVEVDPQFFPAVGSEWSIAVDGVEVVPRLGTFVRGEDFEEIEKLRERIRGFFGVGKRAVTRQDFWYIVKSVPGVSDVQVLDVKDGFVAPFKAAKIYVKPYGYVADPSAIVEWVRSYLDQVGSIGIDYDVRLVQWVDVDVYLVVRVGKWVDVDGVKRGISDVVKEMYDAAQIGEWVSISKIYSELRMRFPWIQELHVVLPKVDLQLREGMAVRLRSLRIDVGY